jgi:error-prone DNA polymerase
MYWRRAERRHQGVRTAEELKHCRVRNFIRASGCIFAQQRPGTTNGFIFISMEDETGMPT